MRCGYFWNNYLLSKHKTQCRMERTWYACLFYMFLSDYRSLIRQETWDRKSHSWTHRNNITTKREAYGKETNEKKENKKSKNGSIFPSPSWQELTRGRSLKGGFRGKRITEVPVGHPFPCKRRYFFSHPKHWLRLFIIGGKLESFFIFFLRTEASLISR